MTAAARGGAPQNCFWNSGGKICSPLGYSRKMLLVVPKGSTLEKGEKEGLIALVVIRPVFILSMHPSDQHLALHCALLRVYVLLGHEEQHLLRQHHAACGAAWPAAQPRNGKK